MQNIKKLAVFVLALCVTMPLFALRIEDHPASQKAQARLEAKIRDLLKNKNYKGVDTLVNNLTKTVPYCDKLCNSADVIKEGRVPAKCWTAQRAGYVLSCHLEAANKPGFIKQNGAIVPTVDPLLALTHALAYPKKAGYLDYNKFVALYNKASKGQNQLGDLMDNYVAEFFRNSREDRRLPFFDDAAIVTKLNPNGGFGKWEEYVNWDDYSKRQVNSWYGEAINIYNDRATFQKVKWQYFEDGISRGEGWYPEFWEAFAIQPPFTDQNTKKAKQKHIEDMIRKQYNECKSRKPGKFFIDQNCSELKINAQKYGFWKETPAETTQRVKQAMKK